MASKSIERYIRAAKQVGVPRELICTLVLCGIILQPAQLRAVAAAIQCDHDGGPTFVGYGGARGGGKSHWSLTQLVIDCLRYPGLKCLLLRKTGKKAKESFEDLRQRVLRGVPHEYTASNGEVHFPNGSRIILGHYKDERNIEDYLGIEYDVIAIEESTTLTASKLNNIATCCRSSKPGWRPRIYETTNPGGVSHVRFKKLFIEPWKRENETETRFVPATVKDNAFVNKEYVTMTLDKLVGWQRKAWLEGDWDIASGQYFSNWRDDQHVYRLQRDANGKTIPFQIPDGWTVWGALDYGFQHYTVFHLFAKDGDGRIFVVAEHAVRKKLPAWHAREIRDLLERHGLKLSDLRQIVASPDAFDFVRDKAGLTIAQQYEAEGIKLKRANNARISGAGEILNRLGDAEANQEPTLFVVETCVRLIEAIPAMLHDPNRPEDVDKVDCDPETGEGGDDPYDCCRYGVMAERSPRRVAAA